MICPLCNAVLEDSDDTKYCSHCGQFIKTYSTHLHEKNYQNVYGLESQNQNSNKKKNGSDYVVGIISIYIILSFLIYLTFS